ncbi:MAG: hypothetical protein ACI8Q1_003191 [Parvicella sp.]|jgi:hypothetical protein
MAMAALMSDRLTSPCTISSAIEETTAFDLLVYPNPIQNGLINIETNKFINEVRLFDTQRRQVLYEQPHSNTIDISHLAHGHYSMAVYFEGEKVPVVKSVVK